jgi:type VI secretion system (T6SS) baseplate-like injector VgrG
MPTQTAEERETSYFGKYAGEVMDFDADLPDANALRGDIRVKVAAILEEDDDGNPRPLEVIAKPAFHPGFFYIPEPQDKVWVEFVAGNIDWPIWTGMWYPDGKSPGTTTGDSPTRFQKVIRTKSGHVVQLDDTDGDEHITVLHKSGAQLNIDKDGSVLVADTNSAFLFMNAKDKETTLSDSSGCLLTLKSDGAVVTSSDGTLVEVKNGTVSIVAKDAVALTAKDIVLKSSSVSLGDGASQPAVLGQDFMMIFNAHTHTTAMGPSGPPNPIPPLFAPSPVGKGLSNSVKVAT